MNCRLAIYLLLSWCCLSLSAQRALPFQHLSKQDGLSQVSVFAIAQDSTGFMWFGTRDGLNKYDGYEFTVYRNNGTDRGVIGNDIRSLYVDPADHSLWVGTLSGLSRYQAYCDSFTNYRHRPGQALSLTNDVIRQIYRDRSGRLWVGTSLGLSLYQETMDNFRPIPFLRGGQAREIDVEAIVEDQSGRLLLGTSRGLYELIEASSTKFAFRRLDEQLPVSLPDPHIKSLVVDSMDNLWIGTSRAGVCYWNRQQESLRIYQSIEDDPQTLIHNNVRNMCLDQKGNLWVGTFAGLSKLVRGTTHFLRYRKAAPGAVGLSDYSIRSIFVDERGSLWVGTYYGGVNHYDEGYNRFTNYYHSQPGNSLNSDVISSFAEDARGNLWIGTEGDGLNYYDRARDRFEYLTAQPNGLSGNNVKQLLLDGDQLWIGTFQAGLNVLDVRTRRFRHYRHRPGDSNSLSNDNVYDLRREGPYLWMLTYGGGLDILDLRTQEFLHYQHITGDRNSLSSDLARVFLKTRDGKLWIGTERGLNQVLRGTDGLPVSFATLLPDEKIYTLHEDENQHIWIGTLGNGLYRLNPQTQELRHYRTAQGLPGNTVFGILQAQPGELWLSTNSGLARFATQAETFTNYDYSNGLANSEYNFNAYYQTRRGELLFGGIHGFTLFDPADMVPNQYVPPVVLTAFWQNNQRVSVGPGKGQLAQSINDTETLRLRHNEANFSIHFAALDFFSPENNRYAYKLEGLDYAWNSSSGKTEASYTIQREGEYRFRLRGGNSDGFWNPQERQLLIEVLPPPWRTWWAYLLYVVLLGATIYGLYRFVRLRHKVQLQQIAKEQQDALLEVKLRFFTNITHEFRTPLTLILGPLQELLRKDKHSKVVRQKLELVERNAQRLLKLVNQVLTFRKLATDHEPLRPSKGDLVQFLQAIYLLFWDAATQQNISYSFKSEVPELPLWYDADKLERVFFNLLSNAFKYTPEGGRIQINLWQHGDSVEVVITDNGPGIEASLEEQIFQRFYERALPGATAVKNSGIGLAISRQVVEMHGGRIFVRPAEKGKTGATLVVQLPLKRSAKLATATPALPAVPEEKSAVSTPRENLASVAAKNRTVVDQRPLLLIVEDNPEVNSYIQVIFEDHYRIQSAKNGKEGLHLTREKQPDLVISDVMMPEMDGIAFCQAVKCDIKISHIPILLLTARTAPLFKLEGLQMGADDYVTKPFDPEELRLRVRNLIQARAEIKQKFRHVVNLDPKEVTISSVDEQFLEHALEVIEANMANPQFRVDNLAQALAVSRPLLFTKFKALTGQTPNRFVKSMRLKRAVQLLETGKLQVTEVADRVGYRDLKYFRKSFREYYGHLPSECREKAQKRAD